MGGQLRRLAGLLQKGGKGPAEGKEAAAKPGKDAEANAKPAPAKGAAKRKAAVECGNAKKGIVGKKKAKVAKDTPQT